MIASEKPLVRSDCRDAIAHHRDRGAAEVLRAAADGIAGGEPDRYGAGEALQAFEAQIAAALGKEAAVFMPSGTMAQQIALRIVADRHGCRSFTGHPTNHVVLHEHDGYRWLHGLTFVPAGRADEPLSAAALAAVHEPIATLLVELPQRELGGELPTWDELVEFTTAAGERGWHRHLDGARLWECGPALERSYAEIAALFDSVYVSFYKGIGALGGAMLAGSAPLIAQARIWLRRHGGNLFTLYPYAALARQSFDDRIGSMSAYRDAAQRVVRVLAAYPAVALRPASPRTNMFHAFVRGDAEVLVQRAQRIAREHSIWTFGQLAPTAVPGIVRWEISCGDATLALSDERLHLALDGLFAAGG